jgi:hypothetical protein
VRWSTTSSCPRRSTSGASSGSAPVMLWRRSVSRGPSRSAAGPDR